MQGRTITLPPFSGATRRIVLAYVAAFFAAMVIAFSFPLQVRTMYWLTLQPDRIVHGWLWQLVTYTFYPDGLLSTVFGLLTIWFFGGAMEANRGSRWLTELFYASLIGGGLIATAIAYLHVPGVSPVDFADGVWAGSFAMLVAFGTVFAEEVIRFNFVLNLKAKYLVAMYVLIDLAVVLRGGQRLMVITHLACGLCAFLFVRFAPRRGLASGVSEQYFGVRNGYYRWKRRRAARKFEVYMRKQNREVHFDSEGRYIEPEEEKRDPNSRKWMN